MTWSAAPATDGNASPEPGPPGGKSPGSWLPSRPASCPRSCEHVTVTASAPSSSKTGPSRRVADNSFASDPQAMPPPPTAKPFRSTRSSGKSLVTRKLLPCFFQACKKSAEKRRTEGHNRWGQPCDCSCDPFSVQTELLHTNYAIRIYQKMRNPCRTALKIVSSETLCHGLSYLGVFVSILLRIL